MCFLKKEKITNAFILTAKEIVFRDKVSGNKNYENNENTGVINLRQRRHADREENEEVITNDAYNNRKFSKLLPSNPKIHPLDN